MTATPTSPIVATPAGRGDRRRAGPGRPRRHRAGRGGLVVVAVALVALVWGVVPVTAPDGAPAGSSAEAQTPSYTQGSTPLSDVLAWADAKKCGDLTRDELAAMALVPSYTETGATGSVAPSPMTLSRYDTQSRLYAFSSKGTADKAFFHPGVGMWQFDSAGGWNLTAATAISTYTAGATAATLMAQRYCASTSSTKAGKRAYAWGPWYYCATTSRCENVFAALYQNGKLVAGSDAAVQREGGGSARSCTVSGIGTVNCMYVDPSKAQGLNSFILAGYGPSPITAPFYVFDAGGKEYRYWLKADTGYANTIRASKPITSDARTSLVWENSDTLCDTTANRGACATQPPPPPPPPPPSPWTAWAQLPFATFGRAVLATNADGRLEAFAVSWNGLLYRSAQVAPGGGWGAWTSLGSGVSNAATPAVIRNADGRLQVFVTGLDGGLWNASQLSPGTSWTGLVPLGGSIAGPPSAVRTVDGRLQVFARAPDGSLRTTWQYVLNGGFVPWQSMGGVIPSDTTPAAVVNADGRAQLFVLGTDKIVYSTWQTSPNGGWSGWNYVGGPWTSWSVSAARNADGRIELFTLGIYGSLWRSAQVSPGSYFSTWTSLGGSYQASPTALTDPSGRINVLAAANADGAPTQLRQGAPNGVFGSPVRIGGVSNVPVEGAFQGDGKLAALVTGTDRFLYVATTTSSMG